MDNDRRAEELAEIVRAIQDRVRVRYPQGDAGAGHVPLPDLTPVLHARDRAEAKVAAIGSVNPRAPGLLNSLIQSAKKLVARALDWHVREQVEFNRAAIDCIATLLAALNEYNRTLQSMARELAVLQELRDMRSHWAEWRVEWERKLSVNEVQFLRSVADLQSAYQHRASLMESNFRDLIKTQHSDFTVAVEKSAMEIQKRLWADLDRIRTEYERVIHGELRVARQRAAIAHSPERSIAPAAEASPLQIDWLRFADRFRGPYDYVKESQRFYVPWFQGSKHVLDIGCGRGEFLDLMSEAGIPARGIDLNQEMVALCRSKGWSAETADLFEHLRAVPAGSLDGVFCAQVVEHLPPECLPEMIRLAREALDRGGLLAIETPNPECLAILATHFYLDPTHTRPIPPMLLAFYLEETGFGRIEIHRRSPALETLPSLGGLPDDFRAAFFDGLDYAILGRKL